MNAARPTGPGARQIAARSGRRRAQPHRAVCAGEPILLAEADLIATINDDYIRLHDERDPEDYRPAEVALDYFHQHVGIQRRTKGDRAAAPVGQDPSR